MSFRWVPIMGADPVPDRTLAGVLLSGYVDSDKRGLPRRGFLEDGSLEENRCRAALARLLRSGEPLGDIAEPLAALIEPQQTLAGLPGPARRMKFERRGTGRPMSDVYSDSHIAFHVLE